MKDFDQERNSRPLRSLEQRSFTIGGQTFVMRDRVRPEAYAPMDDLKGEKRDRLVCTCDHARVAHGPNANNCQHPGCKCEAFTGRVLEDGSTMREVIAAIDTTFLSMVELDNETEARYREMREREWDIIEIDDLRSVVEWMVSESTSRPTGPPPSSTPLPEPTGASSTAGSSLPVTQAA